MLTPAPVLTNRNCGVNKAFCLLLAVCCLPFVGCAPPGPAALLEGKKLIEQGRPGDAVAPLEKAAALLPKNALAWNYLGLAYHGSGHVEPAIRSYRAALALDHKLGIVRYNLGCLHLEQGNVPAAVEELRSFTLLQPAVVEGWLRLGTAQLKARRLDEAEKSFRSALDLHAKHPEALNGLGLIQVQRRRYQEALNHFNLAAVLDPPYPPALLNSAILHQQLNNRSLALQRYRQYVALRPRPADWEAVELASRQLDLELNPPQFVARTVPAAAAPKTNSPVAQPAPQSPGRPLINVPASLQPLSARTNPAPTVALTRPTNTTVASSKPAAEVIRPVPVEVARVQPDLVVKPAQDLSRSAIPAPAPEIIPDSPARPGAPKRNFLSRINPFGGKGKSQEADVTLPAAPLVIPDGVVASARYSYLSPTAPTPGDPSESGKAFKRGLKAQKAGNRAQAVTEYQAAVKIDPANYDAYYNLGLAALDGGDAPLSLWAYEIALSLKPAAEDARYNFALALKSGGYWQDSVDQLRQVLTEHANDARAHLSLANLFAQQLRQPVLAREHYLRVLELNPRHPEATKIRYWLAANGN